jgi:hypothetical protein
VARVPRRQSSHGAGDHPRRHDGVDDGAAAGADHEPGVSLERQLDPVALGAVDVERVEARVAIAVEHRQRSPGAAGVGLGEPAVGVVGSADDGSPWPRIRSSTIAPSRAETISRWVSPPGGSATNTTAVPSALTAGSSSVKSPSSGGRRRGRRTSGARRGGTVART